MKPLKATVWSQELKIPATLLDHPLRRWCRLRRQLQRRPRRTGRRRGEGQESTLQMALLWHCRLCRYPPRFRSPEIFRLGSRAAEAAPLTLSRRRSTSLISQMQVAFSYPSLVTCKFWVVRWDLVVFAFSKIFLWG